MIIKVVIFVAFVQALKRQTYFPGTTTRHQFRKARYFWLKLINCERASLLYVAKMCDYT